MNFVLAHLNRRLIVAPFLGLLAGFLLNRARSGELGYALLWEMVFGAVLVSFGAMVIMQLNRMQLERQAEHERQLNALASKASQRRIALVEAEATRYRNERLLHEQAIHARAVADELALELDRQREQTGMLQKALSALASRVANVDAAPAGVEWRKATARIERLEAESRESREARERLLALESAQEALRRESVEVGMRAMQEAEEVKASLLHLAISESQRQRNINAPESDQSGRIIELEARIKRLAFEIERLSTRQFAVADQGEASKVGAEGTKDNARIGFLRAMLDANKVLRQQIKEAA